MKKIICLILWSILSVYSYAQSPCGNNLNWDWTLSSSYNKAYVSGQGIIPISSPFQTESSANGDLIDIIRGKDYLKAEGWVLIDKVFGCPDQYMQTQYPYFILYNKYRSILRFYIFNNSGFQYQKATATLSWTDNSINNALFAPSQVYQWPNEKYHTGDQKSGTIINYIQDYYTSSWFVTEFPVTFDHKIDL